MAGRDATARDRARLVDRSVSGLGRRSVRRRQRSAPTPVARCAAPFRPDLSPRGTDDLRVSGSTPRSAAPAPTEPRVRRIAGPRRVPHRRAPPERSRAASSRGARFVPQRTGRRVAHGRRRRDTCRLAAGAGPRQFADRSARRPSAERRRRTPCTSGRVVAAHRRPGHARRERQCDRGCRRGRPDGGPALLDRPVRGSGRDRARRSRHGVGAQRGHGRCTGRRGG